MELSQLTFLVSTEQLLKAKTAIDDLAASMDKLNKIQVQEAKVAKESAKSKESLTKTTEESAESTKKSVTVLERQQQILKFMTDGFSKGQASVLSYAKSSGALASELKELESVLQTQRKLIGGDTFDKSMSGLTALKNQYGEIREAIRQYNSDMDLTRNQTRELARDKERIIEKMKLEGSTFSDIKNAVRDYNVVYTEQASRVNSLIKVERDREKASKDHVNAIRNVASAEERLFSTVSHINDGLSSNATLNERAALAVGSYERNLRLAGITGLQAASKLQKFKSAQEQITALERKRQGDYVARATGVQLGDVGVSLASGQNPLIVMIQQGDQLRSILQTAGRDGLDLRNVMNDAAVQIARSFKDVGIAVGTFIGGAFTSAGKSMLSFFGTVTGLSSIMKKYQDDMLASGPPTKGLSMAMRAVEVSASLAATGLGMFVVVLGAIAVALYQATKANDALVISMGTTGASLGMNAKQVATAAEDLNKYGTSANELKGGISALAAEGFKQKEMLDIVTDAAQKYAQITGSSIDEVLKAYGKVAKDPVAALVDLAEKTGKVDVATINMVESFVKAGDKAQAAEKAIRIYAEAQKELATDMEKNISAMSKLWIQIKEDAKAALDGLSKIATSEEVAGGLTRLYKANKLLLTYMQALKDIVEKPWKINSTLQELFAKFSKLREDPADIARRTSSGKIGVLGAQTPEEMAAKNAAAATGLEDFNKAKEAIQKLGDGGDKLNKYRDTVKEISRNYNIAISYAKKFGLATTEIESNYLSAMKKAKGDRDKSGTSKDDTERKRLQELANYYNLQANQDANYSPDYLNKKQDLSNLFQSSKIEPKAFAMGMDELERAQPWFKEYERATKAQKDLTLATDDFTRSMQQQQDTQLLGIKNSIESIGLTEEQKLVNAALLKVEEDRIKNLEKIADLTDRAAKSGTMSPEELSAYNKKLLAQESLVHEQRKLLVEQSTKDAYTASHSFEAGWNNAFASYTDSAKNAADTGRMMFERMTDGMTDAIVQFVTTGKLSFKDFANSIIVELIKIQAKSLSTQILGNSSTGILGSLFSSVMNTFTGGAGGPASVGPSAVAGGGSWLGNVSLNANADGNAFSSYGILHKFAKGSTFTNSIVNQPTPFMFANGGKFGVMGEAGPEAILPLQRNRSGQLGVVSSGGGNSVNIEVNVAISSDGTSRTTTSSNSELEGNQLGKAIASAVQAEIVKQKRNGGLLA